MLNPRQVSVYSLTILFPSLICNLSFAIDHYISTYISTIIGADTTVTDGQTSSCSDQLDIGANENRDPTGRESLLRPLARAGFGLGFTLIEFLVVLAIVAVLTGLLLTVITKAMKYARSFFGL